MALSTPDRLVGRRDAGYEAARRDAVWNELKPDRYPEASTIASG
jgi:hypothetical protein